MKSYLFVTDNGYTEFFIRGEDESEENSDNWQVLGEAEGETPIQAFEVLLAKHLEIKYQIIDGFITSVDYYELATPKKVLSYSLIEGIKTKG